MSQFDPASLPEPLAAYFSSADRRAVVELFAPDARVGDEGREHVGTPAIADWLESVETRYHPRYRIEAAETSDNSTVVTFIVSGTFPGSPATLRQQFVVEHGRITRLTTL